MGFLDSTPFIFVKDVGCLNWFLNGGVKISLLEVALFIFDLEEVFDIELVLVEGLRRYEGKMLHLDWWVLEIGCFRSGVHGKEV